MKHPKRFAARLTFLASVAVLLSACGSGVQFIRQDMTEYPPKPSTAVVEIHEGSVMKPHVVIGTLTAGKEMKASYDDSSTYDEVLESLKAHARKVGADALVDVKPVGDAGTLTSRVELTATAIHYLSQASTVTN